MAAAGETVASDAAEEPEARRIVQLEEGVINRIAAGEVVVRPANALKELLENSLDAGSRHIAVMVKGGGLKMLRIEDDGHGIRAEDLPILCERFTTSKLRKYEDLNSIGTFGFRGEALASISHVAHVTVTTMTAQDSCARMAQYSEGKLRGPPRPCAGTRGTTLVAEDMFYNNSTRRAALGKDTIEHAKVLEVVQRYAVHNPSVGFTCRKATSSVSELTTVGGEGVTSKDVISTIYGQSLARELFPFEVRCEDPSFTCKGFASGANHSTRYGTLILFINNRLVECGPLKKAIEAVYQPVLPRHQHPWVYLSLDLDASSIDVNVHPTKMEVQFLHEETIAQRLQETLAASLRSMGASRTFATSVVPSLAKGGATFSSSVAKPDEQAPTDVSMLLGATTASSAAASTGDAAPITKKQRTESAAAPVLNPVRVRTDHRQKSLESMFRTSQASQAASQATQAASPPSEDSPESATQVTPAEPGVQQEASPERRAAFEEAQQLTSIEELREAAKLAGDDKLSKSVLQSVYVGPVNRELVLLQCGAALCLTNLAILARECAYQRLLRLIGGVGSIELAEPLPLQDLMKLGILDPDSGYDPEAHKSVDIEALALRFASILTEKAELLNEYFMLELDIEGGKVKAVPNGLGLSSDLRCSFDSLPLYLVRLCTEVNWEDEKECLDESVEALDAKKGTQADAFEALNAAVEAGDFEDVAAAAAAKRPRTSGTQELQCLRYLHEAVRKDGSCSWPRDFARDGTLLDLVSLDQLYKIFERC
eukprot:TRINITY_DN10302_c0_g1_i1.p1 TRINITY_DN10302_c0_g1~~TRINITY_DN10302_c0_g1_i1.p1  ORF type:complete len:779 (+),score=205.27 TRINITY_DN10302_c0_g1_i1:33-2339(+)